MRFWDSSAVVPLLVPQRSSACMEKHYAADPLLNVWCLTPIEVWSAICRLRLEGLLDSSGVRTARRRLQALAASWVEIDELQAVRNRAQRLLESHALRAGDSLQLAAALLLVGERPERVPFVTLDSRLAEAAEREGFEIEGVTQG
jgi:predicted nucleic acid-binding protein